MHTFFNDPLQDVEQSRIFIATNVVNEHGENWNCIGWMRNASNYRQSQLQSKINHFQWLFLHGLIPVFQWPLHFHWHLTRAPEA